MKKYTSILRESLASYWAWWRSDPKAAVVSHARYAMGLTAITIAATIAMYYHGIPHIRYVGKTLDGSKSYWEEAAKFSEASYCSFPGTLDVTANEYSAGCGFVIWVPIEHIEELDQKLPFSILHKAEDWFRTEPPVDTRQRL